MSAKILDLKKVHVLQHRSCEYLRLVFTLEEVRNHEAHHWKYVGIKKISRLPDIETGYIDMCHYQYDSRFKI